jgi:hypothetical protein
MSDTARDQAQRQVDSICQLVAALEVDYDRLEELREERASSSFASLILAQRGAPGLPIAATAEWWEEVNPSDADELEELEAAAGDCESADDAQERISEDPLSIEVRSGWSEVGDTLAPDEFRVVLCTGGPHVEILGDLDGHGEPDRVRVMYRGWGESGELHDFDHEAVLTYCRQFTYVH